MNAFCPVSSVDGPAGEGVATVKPRGSAQGCARGSLLVAERGGVAGLGRGFTRTW